ncbi:hypothetical protein QBC42DRAFT_267376 [Cladorrhinum samala]|uniref:Uncharacterized protein n=1 Tax=Cladorrhinum samala TaxID=585594 RepID=A0AAV9HPI6_9PEZI|nr:hypothetical protein QBC42DRAFT_267376 [Cladorrhinum samala]
MTCGSGITGACHSVPCNGTGPHNIRQDPSYLRDASGRGRAPRRRTYFNQTLHEVSVRVQHPDLISFREAILALVVLYAAFKAVFAGINVYDLLFGREISPMCWNMSPGGCAWVYVRWYLWAVLMGWGSEVIPWAICGVVVAFFGEEVLRKVKGRK